MINFKKLKKVATFKGDSITWTVKDTILNAVYIIRVSDSSFYIGSTANLQNRIRGHVGSLRRRIHSCKELQDSYDKKSTVSVYVLEICPDENIITEREQFYIDLLSPSLNKKNAFKSVSKSNIHLRFKDVLKSKKMTVVSLAERVGITQPNMSNIVNGKTSPSLDTVEKIAIALGVPVTDLFEDPKKKKPFLVCPHCGKEIKLKVD